MDAARHEQIARVFTLLRGQPADQRGRLLAEIAPDDRELREQVESLLEQSDRTEGFLDQPALGTRLQFGSVTSTAALERRFGSDAPSAADPASPDPASIGGSIAGYRILRVLGHGGMGVVYLAEQEHPRRLVALKALASGADAPDRVRRFEHEAQLLARLHHPGIAQIFEAGLANTALGLRPYFAMELVEGRTLIEHVQRERVDRRGRLALFVSLCEAVEHAHRRGILHRDLKPANILVNEHGEPKILDFGIARTFGSGRSTVETAAGQVLGTLPYMSPEQIQGEHEQLDARSDVYALGVILYELLAGRLPYPLEHASMPEAARIIREEEPRPLGLVDRELRGDLEVITTKALQKEPDQRYPSAAAFAADILRHLQDEPIAARPPSTAYQLAKFARRNRILVAGVAATIVALGLGVVGTAWQARRANQRSSELETALKTSNTRRDEAIGNLKAAQAASEFLRELVRAMEPARSGPSVTLRAALEHALEDPESSHRRNPVVEATVDGALAHAYCDLEELQLAEQHARRALELLETTAHGQPLALGRVRAVLVQVLIHQERLSEAEELNAAAIAELESDPLSDRKLYALALAARANIARLRGDHVASIADIERELDIMRELHGDESEAVLLEVNRLGVLLYEDGRKEEAFSVLREGLDVLERTDRSETSLALDLRTNLADMLRREGRLAEARPLLERLVAEQERVFGSEHKSTSNTMIVLSRLLEACKEPLEAVVYAEEGVRHLRVLPGIGHSDTLVAMNNLALLRRDLGWRDGYLELFEEMAGAPLLGDSPELPRLLELRRNVADVLTKEGRYDEAEALYCELLEAADRHPSKRHSGRASFEVSYSSFLHRTRRYDEAERRLLAVVDEVVAQRGASDATAQMAMRGLTWVYSAMGRREDMEAWKQRLADASAAK